MSRIKVGFIALCFLGWNLSLAMAQTASQVVGVGRGSAETRASALEAAKLDAVNNLILTVLKRDTVFRDLFVSEAYKNDWFVDAVAEETAKGQWTATTSIKVEEDAIEALHLGRYSTTVGALLDQAERAVAEIETALAEAAVKESNGDLGGSETAYRQAEANAVEALRYIGPVNDAVYFSSIGNRKALELQAVIKSYQGKALSGIDRIREGRDRLSLDLEYKNALSFLETIEAELSRIEAAIAELRLIAASPMSYDTDNLRSQNDIGQVQKDSLIRHRQIVIQEKKKLDPSMEYPILRAGMILDKIDGLARLIDASRSALGTELFKRSAFAKTLLWTVDHEPREYLSVGLFFPAVMTVETGKVAAGILPLRFEGRVEGAVRIGDGGLWGRTRFIADEEDLIVASGSSSARQQLEIGFFGGVLVGAGFRWDWYRSAADGTSMKPIMAVSILLGAAGSDLGESRPLPLWTFGIGWELPRGDNFVLARDLNLSLESVIRPSAWVKIDTDLATKARETSGGGLVWVGAIAQGLGFRLPFIKPILWKFRWEGELCTTLVDGQFSADGKGRNVFRFGLEYAL